MPAETFVQICKCTARPNFCEPPPASSRRTLGASGRRHGGEARLKINTCNEYDKVLMYPSVHSEIVEGRLAITGNYDNNELLLIKSVILGGALDCKAQIINQ